MTTSQVELLQYAASVSDGINWYKIHRKYFGDSAYEEINENLTKLLEELVRLGYLSMTAQSGQIEIYRITEIGLRVINNQKQEGLSSAPYICETIAAIIEIALPDLRNMPT